MPTKQEFAWGTLYQERRSRGEIGWTVAESYIHKQSGIETALCNNPIRPPARFLELGCGAGNTTLWMAEHGYESFGIDRVPAAIEWAQSRTAGSEMAVDFRVGNISNMSCFRDGFFEIVFEGDCFHMITGEDRRECFSEVRRGLRSGGLFITGGNTRDPSATGRVEFGGGSAAFDREWAIRGNGPQKGEG